jgi:hypothetical protein
MIILGDVVALVGVGLGLNVGRAAERLANAARPFPWWVKWPLTDDPGGYRVIGGLLAVMGVLVIVAVH